MFTEHRRDAGVIFNESVPAMHAAGSATQKVAVPALQKKRSHDPGATLEPTAYPVTAAPPSADAEVHVEASPPKPVTESAGAGTMAAAIAARVERRRDPGIVLDNGESILQARSRAKEPEANFSSMLFSVIELVGAAARFTADQIQTGFRMVQHPTSALEVAQQSIQSCAKAMNNLVDETHKT
jgi:hypothetical protein